MTSKIKICYLTEKGTECTTYEKALVTDILEKLDEIPLSTYEIAKISETLCSNLDVALKQQVGVMEKVYETKRPS